MDFFRVFFRCMCGNVPWPESLKCISLDTRLTMTRSNILEITRKICERHEACELCQREVSPNAPSIIQHDLPRLHLAWTGANFVLLFVSPSQHLDKTNAMAAILSTYLTDNKIFEKNVTVTFGKYRPFIFQTGTIQVPYANKFVYL